MPEEREEELGRPDRLMLNQTDLKGALVDERQ